VQIEPNADLSALNTLALSGRARAFARAADAGDIDTALQVVGAPANRWMAIAQCFAGPPEDPPVPGTRVRAGAAPCDCKA